MRRRLHREKGRKRRNVELEKQQCNFSMLVNILGALFCDVLPNLEKTNVIHSQINVETPLTKTKVNGQRKKRNNSSGTFRSQKNTSKFYSLSEAVKSTVEEMEQLQKREICISHIGQNFCPPIQNIFTKFLTCEKFKNCSIAKIW